MKYAIGFCCILAMLVTMIGEAMAIPVFARKYGTSCATCHEAFPRLNAAGEAFRMNGYKFAEDEAYIKDEPVVMGQEAYKRVWPEAVWPSDIPGLPPISLRLISDYNIDIGGTKAARSSFEFPGESKLLSAGALGDSMSFFLEIEFENGEGGHGHEEGSGTTTEFEGWLQLEDLLGTENLVNLKAGSVGMHEIGLFTSRGHTRLSKNAYLHEMWTMPEAGHELETTNNFMMHPQPGIEVNGFGRNWRYVVGVVNGNMSTEDNNSEKDVYTQLTYKFGGLGFDGSGMTGELGSGAEGFWQDDSLTLSLFGYRGKALITDEDGNNSDDDFWRFGPGARFKHRDLALAGGFIFGKNDNPYGTLSGESVDSRAWFLEGEYFVYPWLVPFARYESLDLDLPSGVMGLQSEQDRSRIILGASMLLRANVRLVAEGRFYTENEITEANGEKNDDNEIAVRLDFAF